MAFIRTSELLKAIGFVPVVGQLGCDMVFDFGNFKLSAVEGMNRRLADVWSFMGVNRTGTTLSEIEFELPLSVESAEQGLAIIAYGLGKHFEAKRVPAWYHQGLLFKHLLPWERERAVYQQRPLAVIDYGYLKLVIAKLKERATLATEEDVITMSFDGAILSVDCGDEVLVAMGRGDAWNVSASVRTKNLERLPQRIRKDGDVICIWEGKLYVGGVAFLLITDQMEHQRSA